MLWFISVCLISSFSVSVVLTALMRVWAPQWGLIDQPAARKVHVTPTPMGGGTAIVLGFLIPAAMAFVLVGWIFPAYPQLLKYVPKSVALNFGGLIEKGTLFLKIVSAGLVLSIVGLWDDLRGLSWKFRLFVQFGLAISLVLSGVNATVFVERPWFGSVLTVFWIVALINSFNFLDNMDALSGGIGLIAASLFALVQLSLTGEPRWLVAGALLLLVGALAGFLVHNRPPAKIFMGDAGSTFLGLMLSSLTIVGTFYDTRTGSKHVMLAPLCIMAVPLYDLLTVTSIRLLEGRSPFQPDKSHFSHRLVELGLTKPQAVLTVHLATLTTGLGALLLYKVPDWTGALLVIGLILCLLWIVAILETVGRKSTQTAKAKAAETAVPLNESVPTT